jgi:RNA polymerase sigma factor (sigma-70 family)
MTTNGLRQALDHLHKVLCPSGETTLTDGQLLARFVASSDETAFAGLVRRHGPMVLGVCRRVLRHAQDAEDAFQATFLVLARKASSVANEAALGGWLYRVSYRIALEAKAINDRRRSREKQVGDLPHPATLPAEPRDWRPWLDRELDRLPEKYRAAVVLCDLEGRPRKEVAQRLKLPEGTLSSRLTTARRMLAKRLARYGLSLSGGALAAALAENTAAALPAPLLSATVKTAVLAAAGELTTVSTSVGILMKGALTTMFVAKLKTMVGVIMVAMALGATSLAYRASAQPGPAAEPRKIGKSLSEVEALRRENELLKLNLEVVLEKVKAQEAELKNLKAQAGQTPARALAFSPDGKLLATAPSNEITWLAAPQNIQGLITTKEGVIRIWDADTGKQIKKVIAADKAVQTAKDKDELRRTVDALEKAVKDLREQLKKQEGAPEKKP